MSGASGVVGIPSAHARESGAPPAGRPLLGGGTLDLAAPSVAKQRSLDQKLWPVNRPLRSVTVKRFRVPS